MLAALGEQPRAREDDKDRESSSLLTMILTPFSSAGSQIERLRRDIEKKSGVLAEVVEENLSLKRGL